MRCASLKRHFGKEPRQGIVRAILLSWLANLSIWAIFGFLTALIVEPGGCWLRNGGKALAYPKEVLHDLQAQPIIDVAALQLRAQGARKRTNIKAVRWETESRRSG